MACGRPAGTVDLALVPALTPNGRPAWTGAVMTTALDDVPKKIKNGAEALRRRVSPNRADTPGLDRVTEVLGPGD